MRFHGADLTFTEGAMREIARVALERGTGARGLRSVVEDVLEGVLFEAEDGLRYIVTEKTVRGGEPVKQNLSQPRALLGDRSYAWIAATALSLMVVVMCRATFDGVSKRVWAMSSRIV
jgi:C-terminal, D2-small domain, of ClpB protein